MGAARTPGARRVAEVGDGAGGYVVVVHATNVSGRSAPVLRPQGNAGLVKGAVQPVGADVTLSYVSARLNGRRYRVAWVGPGSLHGQFDANRIPAIRCGIPRYRGLIEPDPYHRREWRIVQSQFDLHDLSP